MQILNPIRLSVCSINSYIFENRQKNIQKKPKKDIKYFQVLIFINHWLGGRTVYREIKWWVVYIRDICSQ